VGVVGTVGLISLGPLALVPAAIAGRALGNGPRSRQSAVGLLAGAGLTCLYVAYVQRQGPGTTCWRTASAAGCDGHLNPLPWLIVGLILLIGGFLAQGRRRWDPGD
jgi:hypothetical protein